MVYHSVSSREDVGIVEDYKSRVSWGAIFAGWLFALSFATILYILGTAVGITTADAANEVNKGIAFGTAAWMVLSWIGSLFLGGYFGSRFAGKADPTVGAMHGMTVWALSTVLTLLTGLIPITGAVQAGTAVGKGALMAGATIAAGGTGAAQAVPGDVKQNIGQTIKDRLAQSVAANTGAGNPDEMRTAIEQMDQAVITTAANQLVRGDQEGAKNTIAGSTTLSRTQVDQLVASLSAQANEFKGDLAEAADKAATVSSAALWVLFFSTVLGLLTATIGGLIGSRSVGVVYGPRV